MVGVLLILCIAIPVGFYGYAFWSLTVAGGVGVYEVTLRNRRTFCETPLARFRRYDQAVLYLQKRDALWFKRLSLSPSLTMAHGMSACTYSLRLVYIPWRQWLLVTMMQKAGRNPGLLRFLTGMWIISNLPK